MHLQNFDQIKGVDVNYLITSIVSHRNLFVLSDIYDMKSLYETRSLTNSLEKKR